MEPTQAEDPKLLASFEGLVVATQKRFDGIKRYDAEEVKQLLRLRVWKALLAWNPREPRTARRIARGDKTERELLEGWVYGCLANQVKDLLKRDRKPELLIEDLIAQGDGIDVGKSKFESHYLRVDDRDVFGAIEDSAPLVPNTLSPDERQVLACMYLGYNGPETATKLGMTRQKVASCVRSIREKMRDWRPGDRPAAAPEPSIESPAPAVAA